VWGIYLFPVALFTQKFKAHRSTFPRQLEIDGDALPPLAEDTASDLLAQRLHPIPFGAAGQDLDRSKPSEDVGRLGGYVVRFLIGAVRALGWTQSGARASVMTNFLDPSAKEF
jgi:hypothetical protein